MPRLCTEKQASDELGLDLSVFRHWVRAGRLPPPLEGTDRFDLKACHAALDRLSGLDGIAGGHSGNALDAWLNRREASHAR